jgi:hypothetical protein
MSAVNNENYSVMTQKERIQARADWVKQFIEDGDKKGVKISFSVNVLSNKILFLSERQIYNDLKQGRSAPPQEQNNSNKY